MQSVAIEYAHIYTNQKFSQQHELSIKFLQKRLRRMERQGQKATKVIMIDDYSPGVSLSDFDLDNFLQSLSQRGALPDVIVQESALVSYCQATLDLIADKKLRKSLNHYIRTRQKYPCSLFVAAWYLLRLGAFGEPSITCLSGNPADLLADQLVSILPESFVTPEDAALEIIGATPYKDLISKVERVFFDEHDDSYSEWNAFNAEEYVHRNYAKQILHEDAQIIAFIVKCLKQLDIEPGSQRAIADVGAGPNLYPSLLVSPLLAQKGNLQLIDFSQANIDYLEEQVQDGRLAKAHWGQFADYMKGLGWPPNMNKLKEAVHIRQGSIFDLPRSTYDMVLSFFVSESITDDRKVFKDAVKSLIDSLKPGGYFITAHMVGSRGYFAGEGTLFPAVDLSLDEIESVYEDIGSFETHLVTHENQPAVRKGYSGMVAIIGQKTKS